MLTLPRCAWPYSRIRCTFLFQSRTYTRAKKISLDLQKNSSSYSHRRTDTSATNHFILSFDQMLCEKRLTYCTAQNVAKAMESAWSEILFSGVAVFVFGRNWRAKRYPIVQYTIAYFSPTHVGTKITPKEDHKE